MNPAVDRNGSPVKPGDRVLVEFVVAGVFPNSDPRFCNTTLRAALPMPGTSLHAVLDLSTRQTLLLESLE